GDGFSVDVLAARGPRLFDPAVERNRLMSKFPTTNQKLQTRESRKQQGSVGIVAIDDGSSFEVPTVIGNETFNLIFDTGSADLWVFLGQVAKDQNQGHPIYVPSDSSNLLSNYNFSIKYASGASVNGTVYTDTVKVGPVVAEKQAVQAALNVPYAIDADGILGLASGGINTVQLVKQKTFFETVLPTLSKRVFAADFRVNSTGSWDFGYLNETKYKGDINHVNVVLPFKHWTMVAGQYSVGDGPLSATSDTLDKLIVDSGSSLLYLPDPAVKAYYNQVPGFKMSFGGVDDLTLTVPGKNINFGIIDRFKNLCTGAITGKLNLKYAVLGNIFMQNYNVVHSYEGEVPKLGFGSR
ncbi:hypothetical protein E4U43_006700, partial [Claviceps pusilla]